MGRYFLMRCTWHNPIDVPNFYVVNRFIARYRDGLFLNWLDENEIDYIFLEQDCPMKANTRCALLEIPSKANVFHFRLATGAKPIQENKCGCLCGASVPS
jgi:hypothetical protein